MPADALAPRRARGRGDPHHARGRRRAGAARAALLRRQGLDRAAAARREGVPAGQVPVPGHARRHGAQLPRGDRVPRPPRRRARRAARRRVACRSRSTRAASSSRPGRARRGNQLQTTTLLDAIEEHGFDAAMGGARRDEERARAKERIFSFRDDFGQWNPRAQRPELWNLYNAPHPQGRARSASSRSRTGPSSTSGSTSRASSSSCRRSTSRTSARCSGATGCSTPPPTFVERLPDEEPFTATVRFRTVGDMSCTGGVVSHAATIDEVVDRDRRDAHHRARRDARRRPRHRGGDGGPQARWLLLSQMLAGRAAPPRHGGLGRRRQVDADRPAALRHEADPRRPARAHRGDAPSGAATATSTSRCSPTACAPSASRASRSTSPTARSSTAAAPLPARRRARARAVHAQHGHRRVDRGRGRDPASTRARASSSRRAATATSRRSSRIPHVVVAVNKMDLVDFSRGALPRDRGRPPGARRAGSACTTSARSRCRRCAATTSSTAATRCRGTTGRRCSSTSRRSSSPATATSTTAASRCSG